ncbi:MAG TPA: xanthine dehydrogenase small subunit [Saliniramus sp.]|nr:xanthine dehydrogenase small subunit [Saliniramus sp.]
MRQSIRFRRNGRIIELDGFHPRTTLLDYLRSSERATGTKEGCNEGDCGACTVALGRIRDGALVYEPVNACILLLGQIDGADLVTVEDLARDGVLHPVQEAMVVHHGSQCGFCTPGIVMSLFVLHEEGARPLTKQKVDDALAGNLCRCTGYRPIVDAALAASSDASETPFAAERSDRRQVLAELDNSQDVFIGDDERFFAAPASTASLADLYQRHPHARIVAGATDVGLWVNKALDPMEKVIWLGRIKEMRRIDELDGVLTIGAGASHAEAYDALARIDPDLGEIMRRFGSVQVRASGTIGGNIANGSPIGDLAPALIALGAQIELQKGEARRSLMLEDFFIAYGRQDRAPGEFVHALRVPVLAEGEVFRSFKVTKRYDEDISAVMGAFKLGLAGREIVAARLAYGGMAATPTRASEAERALVGASLDDEASWAPALKAIARDFQPLTDHRASAGYRARVARNILYKALLEFVGIDSNQTRVTGHRENLAAV